MMPTPMSFYLHNQAISSWGSVHAFDGKLAKLRMKDRTEHDKIILIGILIQEIQRAGNLGGVDRAAAERATKIADIILKDASTQSNILDNMRAEDILAEISSIVLSATSSCTEGGENSIIVTQPDMSVMKVLIEQLVDMETGLCPSGRVVRLYQVLVGLLP